MIALSHTGVSFLLSGLCCFAAMAQTPPPAPAPAQAPAAAATVPPQIKLGHRLQAMRDKVEYRSTVVIVSDAHSYIQAISAWVPAMRWPVLIDDGSPESREDIARFVRGFQPSSVVRWSAPPPKAPDAAPPQGAAGFDAGQASKIQLALQRVWCVKEATGEYTPLLQCWKALKHQAPGIVIARANDHAWTAALPLAAAWGQPLVFVDKVPDGLIDWAMTIADADGLEKEIEKAVQASGFSWDAQGDDIETITLCLNCPERITKSGSEYVALTDRIGRKGDGLEIKQRWAWSGHIFGSASRCAYDAMCSLFLAPKRAWLFDGYPTTEPWNLYDATKAGDILKEAGIQIEVDDTPKQGASDWRTRCTGPIAADLIFVNTKGNNDFFDLSPGQCKPGDIPILIRPAAVHFVHSWSLLFPGKRETVGGRWIERGVFAYCGSVHEPMLQAFVPTPTVAGRLTTCAPFGASVRQEGGPVWKIATIGDPLYSPGPAAKRSDAAIPLGFSQVVGKDLKQQLKDGHYSEGIGAMKLLGKDAEIAKLIAVLLDASPEKVTPRLALECILPAFRAGDAPLVARLFAMLPADLAKDGAARDALWLSAYPALQKHDDEDLLKTLKKAIREEQFEADIHALAAAWGGKFGEGSLRAFYADLRRAYPAKEQVQAIDKASGK